MTETARLLVFKQRTFSSNPADPLFLPVSSNAVSALGFTRVADYPSRVLYAGPSTSAAAVIPALKAEGYDAVVAPEFDQIEFYDYTVDSDTGNPTPSVPMTALTGERGLYLLALQGYPARAWFDDLRARGVSLIEFLPPAGYLARGLRTTVEGLKSSTTYVRGVFPLRPAFKKAFFEEAPVPPSPFRRVAISAIEESPQDSIKGYLDSVSDGPVVTVSRSNGRVGYEASLTDLDIDNLSNFETVYSISPTGQAAPSSERQGLLALQPSFTGSRMTLHPNSPNYANLLVNAGITDFTNTVYGILDTGFDNGVIDSGIHPDFKDSVGNSTVISGVSEFGGGFQDDRPHGTLTASVITGFASIGQRHDGTPSSIGYRYALGLAPTARLRIDKYFDCSGESLSGLAFALARFDAGTPVNVINLSFNDAQCTYTSKSTTVDNDTVTRGRLFTISAGNTTDFDVSCSFVRGPATAKNAIAVGATDNFTIDWGPLQVTAQTCAYCPYSVNEDARNVPAFSAQHNPPKSIVKPDLVAPGVRITGPYTRWDQGFCNGDSFWAFCKNDMIDAPSGVRYGFSAGTSFSAPAVAGAAGVVRRWFRNVKGVDPSPAMTKAILINGARDVAGAVYRKLSGTSPVIGHVPDVYQGWGMLNLTRLLGAGEDYYFFDEGVELSGDGANYTWQKTLYVRDGSKDSRITLVWSEPANGNGKNWPLNDVDLTADQGAGCPCWYGNQLSTSTGYSLPVPPNPASPDRGKNNVEQIIIPAYTFATGAILRLTVILNYDPAPPLEHQRFAVFADNATETSTPPKTYFYTVTPCRVVDTRNAAGQFGGPALDANSERTFQIPPQCGVPSTARSISLNVVAIQPTAAGVIRLFPTGRSATIASSISYGAGQIRANNAVIALGPTRAVTVKTEQSSGTAHFVIDLNGYFQ
jgi:hypothetical protein